MARRRGPMRTASTVTVAGLDEFRRELRKLDDKTLIDGLKDANKQVGDLVVDEAKSRAQTRLQQKAAATLRAGRQQAKAVVTGGTAKVPFFYGAEFGALKYRQFSPWRGSGQNAGYFLFPAMRDTRGEVLEVYGVAIDKLASSAFPD